MTNDTTAMPQDEGPDEAGTSEAQKPAVDELSTAIVTPQAATDEVMQTMPTEVPVTDLPTVANVPPVEAASLASVNMSDPTMQAVPQDTPAQVYEQFDMAAVQPAPDPGAAPGMPVYVQYPGQPGQFYTGQPGAPVPVVKKRRTALWVAIAIIVILLFGGSATLTYALTQPQTPVPNATLRTYCQAVKDGNAQGIYNLLSQQAKVHTSLDDLQKTFSSLNTLSSLGVKYTDCTFSNLHVSGSLAVATISLTISMTLEGQTMTVSSPTLVSLVMENNQWKVDFSNFAQPQPNFNLPNFLTPTTSSN